MNEFGDLIGKPLLRGVDPLVPVRAELLDFLEGKEGQKFQTVLHIVVPDVAEVLKEVVGRRLFGVEPERALGGLAHLLAVRGRQERKGHRVRLPLILSADEVCARENVRPLVVPAELEFAVELPVQDKEVIRLHEHIVELEEGEPPLVAVLKALRGEHAVDREVHPDVPQKIDIIEVEEPVRVVDHDCAVLALEVDELAHLPAEGVAISLDGFLVHHEPHVRAPGRVAHESRSPADEGDGLVPGELHVPHRHELNEVPDVQTVRRGVKSDIEGHALGLEEFPKVLLKHDLLQKSSLF